MKVYNIEVAPIGTNCYVAVNEDNKEAVVVDPGGSPELISSLINELGVKVKAIFLTHGHMDHIGALAEIKDLTKATIYVSKEDAPMLANPHSSLAAMFGTDLHCPPPDKFYGQGDVVTEAGLTFKILATPGHTPGGVCIEHDDVVFCGDTIFCESIGRTDFPGGSYTELVASIKAKLLVLNPETKLLPGHGPSTTVDWEKRRNPFLQ